MSSTPAMTVAATRLSMPSVTTDACNDGGETPPWGPEICNRAAAEERGMRNPATMAV